MAITNAAAKQSALAASTAEVWIGLITVTHNRLGSTIRVSSDNADTVSNGDTYEAGQFAFTWFSDDDAVPHTQLTFANTDNRLGRVLSEIATPLTISMQIVMASDPDAVIAETGSLPLSLRNVQGDLATISGELRIRGVDRYPVPFRRQTPDRAPGLYFGISV